MDSNLLEYSKLETLNVPRETFPELEEFRSLLLKKNEEINLVSKNSALNLRERHIIDSAQIIDFIDKNHQLCTDLGSGSGLPGVVLAIIMKNKKSKMKFHLYEKSYKKSKFLKYVAQKLDLNIDVIQKDIFEVTNLKSDIIVARAFKPIPIILDLINSNFSKYNNIILFLGKNGKQLLSKSLKKWNFECEERKSLTNEESSVVKIFNLKKK
tara:strand:+ start:918 stop:1550 length:633 start_codon:yes stop_codon:yes gene_type:complete